MIGGEGERKEEKIIYWEGEVWESNGGERVSGEFKDGNNDWDV